MILVKNLSFNNDLNTKLTNVTKMQIYSENPIKLAYMDNQENVGLITCEQIVMFMRVGERKVEHQLGIVLDFDVLTMEPWVGSPQPGAGDGSKFKFSLNKKINNMMAKPSPAFLALCSRTHLLVYRV